MARLDLPLALEEEEEEGVQWDYGQVRAWLLEDENNGGNKANKGRTEAAEKGGGEKVASIERAG